jgi:ketosteroid isomerase-like protein
MSDDSGRASASVELVREIYERWDRGESTRDLIVDDLEYVNPPYAVEAGTSTGRRVLAKIREAYPDMRIRPERIIDAGDDVVVAASLIGTSVSGVRMDTHQAYVWTVRDGRAVRFRWFNELAAALAAVGVAPGEVQGE